MEIKDARGKLVEIGSYIRYVGTGTIGKVVDTKKEDEESWVKLENPNLWYSSKFIETVNEKNIEKIKNRYVPKNNTETKNNSDNFENVSLGSGGAEGGG
ncbi:hypothetical protein MBCUT_02420 [Methanobrevibacter cuticularis]|uniref:DUF2098 domain-containing protein n=1 Tax=Methanobrevibacter cuticularis TaxID=47311 RepID=A0A166F6T9_9EURY|nr:DUF2098 family protein [Methanobrevibacter cuticularis]KZX17374.1 hypothetical protein MBCUT_02420 [Methanobrevibacter cuticularis]